MQNAQDIRERPDAAQKKKSKIIIIRTFAYYILYLAVMINK